MGEYRHTETGEVKSQGAWRVHYKGVSLPRTWKAATLEGLKLDAVLDLPPPTLGANEVAMRDGVVMAADGTWGSAWTVRTRTADELAEKLTNEREAMSCSKMQGILTLGETAWGEVLTYRETASWAEQMVIDSAQDWNRTSQNIAFFGYLLNYTDAQMDAMFIAAALVTA
jgi:hypothetical protein